jgi:hypothetical protein
MRKLCTKDTMAAMLEFQITRTSKFRNVPSYQTDFDIVPQPHQRDRTKECTCQLWFNFDNQPESDMQNYASGEIECQLLCHL